MKPIVLTEFGETLIQHFSFPKKDSDLITGGSSNHIIGMHALCNGCIDIMDISQTHKALICRECMLRVVIPKTIETIADLRCFLKRFQKASL